MIKTLNLVVLANDPLARAGITSLLALLPGCNVIGQGSSNLLLDSSSVETALQADLIVWAMGWDWDGQDAMETLELGLPVLALIADSEAAAVAWGAGIRSILSRDLNEDQLLAAIMATASGLAVVSPAYLGALAKEEMEAIVAESDLTPRELEVLKFLAEGMTNKAIAQELDISDHTVKFHVNSILSKLGAQSRTDAVVRATRLGLIAL